MTTDIDISRCCICYDTYNRTNRAPMSMPCGHTFCHRCVRRMTKEILFSCGVCRTISPVGWVPTKKNVVLIQALETLNLLAKDDIDEALDSTPLGKTVDEQQIHQVTSKDMLSYGKRSLQVLACHMKSRYSTFDDAVLAVDDAIIAIDGRMKKNKVSGEPAPRPIDDDELEARLFEDAEVVDRVERNPMEADILWNLNHTELMLTNYIRDIETRTAEVERLTSDFIARRERVMESNRVRRRPVFRAAAVRPGGNDAPEGDGGETNVNQRTVNNDNAATPSANASDNRAGGVNGNREQGNAPVRAAVAAPPNGVFIPPPHFPGPSNFEAWRAMYDQHQNYYMSPAFLVPAPVLFLPPYSNSNFHRQ
uniref:RING-type domain-containing protein n=1 Tax=Panagrellus redivivus TaxID=6233 RepID=A0A7E4VBE0_PANRE